MDARSNFHYYLNWAKARIDEMDAALTSFETKAPELKAEAADKASQALANLRKLRDDFKDAANKQAAANEATWKSVKAQLETRWTAFQTEVNKNIETFDNRVEEQQALFQRQAGAQMKVWHDVSHQLNAVAKSFAADRQADIEVMAKRMNAEAAQAEERLRKLHETGRQSWTVLMTALNETRAVFDRANQAAQDAIRKATS